MEFSDRTKILLVVALVLVAIYLYSNRSSSDPIQNEGTLTFDPEDNRVHVVENENNQRSSTKIESQPRDEVEVRAEVRAPSESKLRKKMRTQNSATNGYKSASYAEGKRGGNVDSLGRFFESGMGEVGSNNEYKPFDPSMHKDSDWNAPYAPGRKNVQSDEDKFNSSDLLPNNDGENYFEDVQAVSVKQRHLINISRPIGVNTQSTTNKNASHDLRGELNNPKGFVGPFLNSSIEPGFTYKGLC